MRWLHCWMLILVGLGLVAVPAEAARLLTVAVEQDGKLILRGSRTDDALPPLQSVTVWRYLQSIPLTSLAGGAVQPNPEQPLVAVLRGQVVVKLAHGTQVARTVETAELPLTRRSADSSEWQLDSAWVAAQDPPGDLAEETRAIVWARWREAWRVPSILTTLLVVSAGLLLGLTSLVLALVRRSGSAGRWLAVTALVLCLLGLVASSVSRWWHSELFGGSSLLPALVAGIGLVLAATGYFAGRRQP